MSYSFRCKRAIDCDVPLTLGSRHVLLLRRDDDVRGLEREVSRRCLRMAKTVPDAQLEQRGNLILETT